MRSAKPSPGSPEVGTGFPSEGTDRGPCHSDHLTGVKSALSCLCQDCCWATGGKDWLTGKAHWTPDRAPRPLPCFSQPSPEQPWALHLASLAAVFLLCSENCPRTSLPLKALSTSRNARVLIAVGVTPHSPRALFSPAPSWLSVAVSSQSFYLNPAWPALWPSEMLHVRQSPPSAPCPPPSPGQRSPSF